jgi:hypothetical protein
MSLLHSRTVGWYCWYCCGAGSMCEAWAACWPMTWGWVSLLPAACCLLLLLPLLLPLLLLPLPLPLLQLPPVLPLLLLPVPLLPLSIAALNRQTTNYLPRPHSIPCLPNSL